VPYFFTAARKHAWSQPVLCGGTTYGANNIELIEPGVREEISGELAESAGRGCIYKTNLELNSLQSLNLSSELPLQVAGIA
jgi:hypothetical protein